MKRHLLLLAAVALMATAAQAQTIEAGGSLQYCHDFAHGKPNLGAELRVVAPVNDVVSLRALANINGILPDGFDRYGAAMVGIAAGYRMAYGFADFGMSLNPSSRQRVNPDIDLGAGLRHSLTDRHHLFAEAGADFTPTGLEDWHCDLFVKLGYTFTLTNTAR